MTHTKSNSKMIMQKLHHIPGTIHTYNPVTGNPVIELKVCQI